MVSPVAFGGHEATVFGESTGPTGYPYGPYAADHLEEMLFPSTTWGTSFALARSQQRTNFQFSNAPYAVYQPGRTYQVGLRTSF